ncbi:hypothetical protein SKAU_G00143110 [Synaphobranchus kaupii]|uniref:Uncharacterized protein n=1 Tax=Synaphobranchus kaupii TaxID=118154 RepID=A0A9Q1J4L3_SYNKA|nr:hypothetical protein SKAU_G00143110 [Synaphobranchus kaupii]
MGGECLGINQADRRQLGKGTAWTEPGGGWTGTRPVRSSRGAGDQGPPVKPLVAVSPLLSVLCLKRVTVPPPGPASSLLSQLVTSGECCCVISNVNQRDIKLISFD